MKTKQNYHKCQRCPQMLRYVPMKSVHTATTYTQHQLQLELPQEKVNITLQVTICSYQRDTIMIA